MFLRKRSSDVLPRMCINLNHMVYCNPLFGRFNKEYAFELDVRENYNYDPDIDDDSISDIDGDSGGRGGGDSDDTNVQFVFAADDERDAIQWIDTFEDGALHSDICPTMI